MTQTKAFCVSVYLAVVLCLVAPTPGSPAQSPRPTYPLQQAAHEGDLEQVKGLLAQDQSQYLRDSALRLAIQAGHTEVAELLISHGARYAVMIAAEVGDIAFARHLLIKGQTANERDSALHAAARAGHKELVELLVSQGADVNARRWGDFTPLFVAAAAGCDLDSLQRFTNFPIPLWVDEETDRKRSPANAEVFRNIVELLIRHGADINAREKQHGLMALHYAVFGGSGEIVAALLDRGAPVNPAVPSGGLSFRYISPLHLAARYGNTAICELLIARGADVNAALPAEGGTSFSNTRLTPLHHAVYSEDIGIVALLIGNRAQANAADSKNQTPLHLAAEQANQPIVEMLLSHGADANAIDSEGRTPLHHAAEQEDLGIVQVLLSYGANADCKSRDGRTPTTIATQNGSDEIVRLLTARHGQVTLHSAASMGDVEALERVVREGVDINRLDRQGRTALHAAANAGQLAAVRWLVEHGVRIDLADDKDATALSLAIRQACEANVNLSRADNAAAAESRYKAVMAFLISRGATTDLSYGIPPGIVQSHGTEIADLLIEAGTDFEYSHDTQATLLHRAAWWGCKEAVARLIALGADLNTPDRRGGTPLHAATQEGSTRYWDVVSGPHEDVLALLLDHGAGVNAANNFGQTALHGAAGYGDVNAVELLIEHGANANAADKEGRTPVHSAAQRGSIEVMARLIERGADLNVVDGTGNTPLLALLSSFRVRPDDSKTRIESFCIDLVRQGARTDACTAQGMTALQLAAGWRFPDLMRELLSRGAQADMKSPTGWTALHAAVSAGGTECVELLVRHGAPVNGRGRVQEESSLYASPVPARTPLQIAAFRKDDKIVELLIAAGADANAADSEGRTSLHLACSQSHVSTVKLLLDRGADANARFPDGVLPAYRAAAAQNRAILEELLRHGVRADAELLRALSETGTTPLHEAVEKGDASQVRKLLDAGIEANIPNRQGSLPIHLAATKGHVEIAKLLIPEASRTTLTGLVFAEVNGGRHELIPELAAHGADLNDPSPFYPEAPRYQISFHEGTPLHEAVDKRNIQAIEQLLANGADINGKDAKNETPLGVAVYRELKEIVALLLARGAEVNNAYTSHGIMRGCIPLHIALSRNVEIAEMLVLNGSDVNAKGEYRGMTPLHMAVESRALFALMLEHGGRINNPMSNGMTCLHTAAMGGLDEMAEYLIDKGAQVNVQDADGNTPLHLAAKGGHGAACRVLLRHKADIHIANQKGLLTLHYAQASDLTDILVDLTPKMP